MFGTTRRQFLAAASAVTTALSGCLGNGRPAVSYDPYAELDWDTVEYHKSEFHNHIRGDVDTAAEIADIYHDHGYTVYGVCDKGHQPTPWPWTEFENVPGAADEEENRDPEEMGVVPFPGCEFTLGDHVNAIFTTLDHSEHSDLEHGHAQSVAEQIEMILEHDDYAVPADAGPMAVVGHPARYYRDPEEGIETYEPHFGEWTLDDGLLGLEAFNKSSRFHTDVELWDALLTEYAPDRMIWGFGVDDPNRYVTSGQNRDVDLRWTTVLLDETEFDPTDQAGSRRAAADAFREGRLLLHQRENWAEDEDPPTVPHVESIRIDADAGTIRIEASDYDELEWVSEGSVVSEAPEIELTDDLSSYVRAHLYNTAEEAETSTQPIGIEAE